MRTTLCSTIIAIVMLGILLGGFSIVQYIDSRFAQVEGTLGDLQNTADRLSASVNRLAESIGGGHNGPTLRRNRQDNRHKILTGDVTTENAGLNVDSSVSRRQLIDRMDILIGEVSAIRSQLDSGTPSGPEIYPGVRVGEHMEIIKQVLGQPDEMTQDQNGNMTLAYDDLELRLSFAEYRLVTLEDCVEE